MPGRDQRGPLTEVISDEASRLLVEGHGSYRGVDTQRNSCRNGDQERHDGRQGKSQAAGECCHGDGQDRVPDVEEVDADVVVSSVSVGSPATSSEMALTSTAADVT